MGTGRTHGQQEEAKGNLTCWAQDPQKLEVPGLAWLGSQRRGVGGHPQGCNVENGTPK